MCATVNNHCRKVIERQHDFYTFNACSEAFSKTLFLLRQIPALSSLYVDFVIGFGFAKRIFLLFDFSE